MFLIVKFITKVLFHIMCLHSNKFDVYKLYKQDRSFVENMKCTNNIGILNKYLTGLIFTLSLSLSLSFFMYVKHNFYL